MPTQLISMGFPVSLIQNQVYALPSVKCSMFCDTAAATFEQSNTFAFTLFTTVTLDANEQIELVGAFLRLTSAGPVTVILKKA